MAKQNNNILKIPAIPPLPFPLSFSAFSDVPHPSPPSNLFPSETIFFLSLSHSEVQGLGGGSINDQTLTFVPAVCEQTAHASAEGQGFYFDSKTTVISLSPHE